MLKKIGFPLVALFALLLVVSPAPATAGVHFGVAIGGPAYVAPVPAYPAYGYAGGYGYPYAGYGYGYNYGYAAPAYAYPYGGVSVGFYGGPHYRGWVAPRGYYEHGRYNYNRGYYRR